MRESSVERATAETWVRVRLGLDGPPGGKVATGLPFLDHMLLQLQRHGRFLLEVEARGDLEVDVHLVAGDTWRVGASRQLAEYGKALGVPVHPLSALERDLRAEVLLVDLPGVHPSMGERWEEVRNVLSRTRAHEVHLVLSATASAAVLRRAQEDLQELGATRCVLTHLDEVDAATLHEALAALHLPLSYLTYSPEVPGDVASARSQAARRWLPQG